MFGFFNSFSKGCGCTIGAVVGIIIITLILTLLFGNCEVGSL